MSSTAGLGQGTQVFDFTSIGKQGLMLDDRKEAKEQAFYDRNKDLFDPLQADGIRAVDAPYINQQLENAMELSAKAQQSKDPADIQAAKKARARVSSLTATSVAARQEAYRVDGEIRKTDEFKRDSDRFNQHLQEFERATAMTEANGGNVAMEDVLYKAPVFYNLDKGLTDFVDADAGKILQGSYESKAFGKENADGTGSSSSTAQVNEQKREELITQNYESQMESNNDFKNAVEAQFMSEYFGTTDLSTDQVSQFNELRRMGAELSNQYETLEDLEADPRLQRDPRAMRRAKRAWGIEAEIDNRGFEMYREAILGKADKGKQTSVKIDESESGQKGGKYGNADFAVNAGNTVESVLGNVNMENVPTDLKNRIAEEGSMLGYSSTPDMKVFKSGTGSEAVVAGGIVASKVNGKTQYYVVEYKPSPDILAKLDRGEDVSGLLQKTDANLVPLQKSRSRIPQNALSLMKAQADAQVEEDVL